MLIAQDNIHLYFVLFYVRSGDKDKDGWVSVDGEDEDAELFRERERYERESREKEKAKEAKAADGNGSGAARKDSAEGPTKKPGLPQWDGTEPEEPDPSMLKPRSTIIRSSFIFQLLFLCFGNCVLLFCRTRGRGVVSTVP